MASGDRLLARLINQARTQDTLKERPYEPGTYITVKDVARMIEEQHRMCFFCHLTLEVNGRDTTALSLLDEDMAHTASNTVVACNHCSVSRPGRTSWQLRGKGNRFKTGLVKQCRLCRSFHTTASKKFVRDQSKADGYRTACVVCDVRPRRVRPRAPPIVWL
jgi:hypothetical protein